MTVMKVPVLYGSDDGSNSSITLQYVAQKLGIEIKRTWDGFGKQDMPPVDGNIQEELLQFVPEKNIGFAPEERYIHSLGKSSPEIIMARDSRIEHFVDAVIYPDYGNISGILAELYSRNYRAVVYGGGTSVSGSLLVDGGKKTVSIDTRYLKMLQIENGFAIVGSGFRGIEVERKLNSYGFTLGNFPESIMHSTVGGWVSTKATGQESNMYGGMENLVLGVSMATSSGEMRDATFPRNSSGMNLRDIAIGSDGKYGVITDVTMKLFRVPERRYFSSFIYRSFREGIDALSRSERFPAVARLSDEVETEFALNTAGDSALISLYRKYINARSHGKGALLIVVNNNSVVNPVVADTISAGQSPAKSWFKGRYSRPNIAMDLWKNGLVPDTLETSTTWDNLYTLYLKTIETFNRLKRELGFRGEIMAHISHLYRSGACIYFTFILKSSDDFQTLMKVRENMIQCFVSNGGTVTHHHGKGKFFTPFMNPEFLKMQDKFNDPLFAGEDGR